MSFYNLLYPCNFVLNHQNNIRMKKLAIVIFSLMIWPLCGNAQPIENLDDVSEFHEGLSAIKKSGRWAFMNSKGEIVIDYRSDLVLSTTEKGDYPIFSDDRCQVVEVKNGISYFGYIDKSGQTVIKPRFLNASNFNNGNALTLELMKEEVAKNTALGKNVVYYKYFEVVIDTRGDILHYLNPSGVPITLDKDYLRKPPKIMSRRLADDLYLMVDKSKKIKIISTSGQ